MTTLTKDTDVESWRKFLKDNPKINRKRQIVYFQGSECSKVEATNTKILDWAKTRGLN